MRTAPLSTIHSRSSCSWLRDALSAWRRRCRRPSAASRSRSGAASSWKCVLLESALDMLDCALLIVDEEGRVEYRNRVATALLAAAHGGLALSGGALTARG